MTTRSSGARRAALSTQRSAARGPIPVTSTRRSHLARASARRTARSSAPRATKKVSVLLTAADDGGERAHHVGRIHGVLGRGRFVPAMDHAIGALGVAALVAVLRPVRFL